jgi:hypothetical protein
MFDLGNEAHAVSLTLYTDAHIVRGSLQTRQRRVSDMLNTAEDDFLVLSDVAFDEFGSTGQPMRAEFAQVNLASVLFAVADQAVEAVPELRTPKVPERALISIPPFQVVGRIHVLPERSLREALQELTGRFVPVTDAMFWSDTVGEARTTAAMVAVNRSRAQILAPHREADPWQGLDRSTEDEVRPPAGAFDEAEAPRVDPVWGDIDRIG